MSVVLHRFLMRPSNVPNQHAHPKRFILCVIGLASRGESTRARLGRFYCCAPDTRVGKPCRCVRSRRCSHGSRASAPQGWCVRSPSGVAASTQLAQCTSCGAAAASAIPSPSPCDAFIGASNFFAPRTTAHWRLRQPCLACFFFRPSGDFFGARAGSWCSYCIGLSPRCTFCP